MLRVIIAGLSAGAVHVLAGPDHLAAVAPLAADGRRTSWTTGLLWGLGHAGGVLLVGVLALLLREVLPLDRLAGWSERLVGVVLVVIGVWGLQRARRLAVHAHEHRHDGSSHAHLHVHEEARVRAPSAGSEAPDAAAPGPHEHGPATGHAHAPRAAAAFGVGIVHGLAGSAHFLGVLPALALPTRLQAISYVLAFGVGTVASMVGFAHLIGVLARRSARTGTAFYRGLLGVLGAVAIAVGLWWILAPGHAGDAVDAAIPSTRASLILRGGTVLTLDGARPRAEALAAADGRVLLVGSEAEVMALRGPATEVVDLRGGVAVPGLVDAHAHFMGTGEARLGVDLMDARSWDEVVRRVASAVDRARPGEWIVGRGWHQSKWDAPPSPSVRGFPVHDALSAVSPDNPVWLSHASGHAGLANARAMQLAGVTAATPDPRGGEILRKPDGSPAGVFTENAEALVDSALARARARRTDAEIAEENRRVILLAQEEALRNGITEVHDAGVSPGTIDLYRRAYEDGALKLRLWVMLSEEYADAETLRRLYAVGDEDGRFTVRAIKAYADGALGSRGAWLLAPYSDDPGTSGQNVTPMSRIRELADLALAQGWQLGVHAIGDRANREVLDAYEAAFAARPDAARDARFRIEHAQILAPSDVPRFAALGVTAAMQGIHSTSDGPWTPDRLGPERTRERAFVFRDLIDSGALVVNGTDSPVESIDPIACLAASVTGRMSDGRVFNPHHLMTREEALRSYTVNAARAGHEEEVRGILAPGMLADVTVLSGDPLTAADEEIGRLRVEMTIVGGDVLYRAEEAGVSASGTQVPQPDVRGSDDKASLSP